MGSRIIKASILDCAGKRCGDGAFPTVDVNLERTEHAK